MPAAMRFFDMNMGPHDAFFSHLSTRELVRLMQTCRRIRSLVKSVCFNVDRLLIPFFGDTVKVARFRQIQRRTGTIISGSTAVQFFNRLTWPESDLDLYVPRETAAIVVLFIRESGYTFHPREVQEKNASVQLCDESPQDYMGPGIADVLDFYNGNKKIQVIIPINDKSPMEIIVNFHSTCVMNIITHNKAFSLYPWSTFIKKEALIVQLVGDEEPWAREAGRETGREKYIERGWKMVEYPSPSCRSELGVRMNRSVGDHLTWGISLPSVYYYPFRITAADSIRSFRWHIECDGDATFMVPNTTFG
ncbi:hypothetical protein C8R45DRAFT_965379 [Mycena sanguinolenta]|nr:hypothetical protein C8R45DRAFT_965379 [Mycena sanguinolenta]